MHGPGTMPARAVYMWPMAMDGVIDDDVRTSIAIDRVSRGFKFDVRIDIHVDGDRYRSDSDTVNMSLLALENA